MFSTFPAQPLEFMLNAIARLETLDSVLLRRAQGGTGDRAVRVEAPVSKRRVVSGRHLVVCTAFQASAKGGASQGGFRRHDRRSSGDLRCSHRRALQPRITSAIVGTVYTVLRGGVRVSHLIKSLMAEIDLQLALCGLNSIAGIDRSIIAAQLERKR